MLSDDTYRVLQSFGLTLYESRAYAELVKSYQLEAKEICDNTEIPLSRIYGVLDNLVNKGWIKRFEGRPLKFEANHPATLFAEHKKALISEIDQSLDLLTNWWDLKSEKVTQPFQIYLGKDQLLTGWEEMMLSATSNVIVLMKFMFDNEQDILRKQLMKAYNRGLNTRIIVSDEVYQKFTDFFVKISEKTPVKRGPIPVRALIIDRKKMLLSISSGKKNEMDEQLSQGLLIDSTEFIDMLSSSMNDTWNKLDLI